MSGGDFLKLTAELCDKSEKPSRSTHERLPRASETKATNQAGEAAAHDALRESQKVRGPFLRRVNNLTVFWNGAKRDAVSRKM